MKSARYSMTLAPIKAVLDYYTGRIEVIDLEWPQKYIWNYKSVTIENFLSASSEINISSVSWQMH